VLILLLLNAAGKPPNSYIISFCFTRSGIERIIYLTRVEYVGHYNVAPFQPYRKLQTKRSLINMHHDVMGEHFVNTLCWNFKGHSRI